MSALAHIFCANSFSSGPLNFDMQKKLNVSLIQSTSPFSFNNFQVVKKNVPPLHSNIVCKDIAQQSEKYQGNEGIHLCNILHILSGSSNDTL